MSNKDIKALAFEEAMAQLEEIIDRLERGDVPLEESIALYERGATLKAHCEAKLRAAKEKIEKIVLDPNSPPRAEAAVFD
ncbi:MAG: exodeoxyribonuclease VII small subunit [Pseudomonadota bacterium]